MATVGYGDVHAVNPREMAFTVVYISFSILLSAYLIGNMTALIVKGSKTERFRDKMTDLIRYMNRNKLGAGIRSQVKDHLLLQYESSYTRDRVVDDIPVAVRSKVSIHSSSVFTPEVYMAKRAASSFENVVCMHS
jgi:hypothetical protein